MFYELKIQLVSLTEEKLSAWFKSEGNPRERVRFSRSFIQWKGREIKTNRLFCRVYSVNTEWEIITKKVVIYSGPSVCFYLWADTAGFFLFLPLGFASSSWPQIRAPRREESNGGTRPRLDDKRPLQGHEGPYFPAINKLLVEFI